MLKVSLKKGAELAGDNPLVIGILMLLLISLLFTTIGGLGAIIMVATIVLPIMSSVGISPIATTGIFLFGLSIGGILNPTNWALYTGTLKLELYQITPFAMKMFVIAFMVSIAYIIIQLKSDGSNINIKNVILKILIFVFVIFGIIYIFNSLSENLQNKIIIAINTVLEYLKYLTILFILFTFLHSFYRILKNKNDEIHWLAYITPLMPLLFILVFKIHPIGAFTIGIIYGYLSTYRKNSFNLLIKSMFEGGSSVMPAVILMLGIGMLLVSIMGPDSSVFRTDVKVNNNVAKIILPKDFIKSQDDIEHLLIKYDGIKSYDVKLAYNTSLDTITVLAKKQEANFKIEIRNWKVLTILQPLFANLVPKNGLSFLIIFSLLAPLSLYRGPLNVWGMGYPVATVFLSSGMPAISIMALLISVGQIQGISDPTNTQNVWLANEMQVDVQKILWNTLPYTWAMAILGLALASIIYY
ncbi:MAG TPA: citrate transporter [Ignavibacteriales bacterium]|nr:citrate transporter [Ignavibacteriales bacterium]HPD68245.1 citrate transporter [Ignavibacteriales bacterium]